MTMQLTGPISIGQARNECKLTGKIDAKNSALSKLAGVAAGSKYAWSDWYGKSFLPQFNGTLYAAYTGYGRSSPCGTRFDLRNGSIIQTMDHGIASQYYYIPDFTVYDYVSVDLVFYNPGDLDHPTGWAIYGSQNAANPWVDLAQWSAPGYGTATPIYVYMTALSIAGATTKTYTCNSWSSGVGAGMPPFTVPAYGSTPAQSFPDVFSYAGPYNAYQQWLWSQQSSGGGGAGGCCFPAGVKMLMADLSWKDVSQVQIGDEVIGVDGKTYPIVSIKTPTLGDKRMMGFSDGSLKWSEEHLLWSRHEGKQWWWAAGADKWREEEAQGLGPQLKDSSTIFEHHHSEMDFAHLSGWVKREVVHLDEYDSETALYLPSAGGPALVFNNYVAAAIADEYSYDYTQIDWKGLNVPHLKHH